MKAAPKDDWPARIETCRAALTENNFQVFTAVDAVHAGSVFFEQVLPGL